MRTLHTGIRVGDLARSLEFYTALGYQVLGEVPETDFGSLTMLKLPEDPFVSIELVHDPDRPTVDPGGLNHFVIHVESMHDTVARLAEHGIDAEPPSSPDGWTTSGRPGSRIPTVTGSSWCSGPQGIRPA